LEQASSFKDAGSVRGLNTAATIWCSAAIGAICGLGQLLYGSCFGVAVLATNIVLRPLAYRLYPAQQSGAEQEIVYGCELLFRPEDETHIRALQAIALMPLSLTSLKSEDVEGTGRMKVSAQIRGVGRHDQALESLVGRLSLEAGVSSISWALVAEVRE
jgi:putative Mg2+ transporter-C (MgtC) family protein